MFVDKQLHKPWQHEKPSAKAALDEAMTFLLNTLRSQGKVNEVNDE